MEQAGTCTCSQRVVLHTRLSNASSAPTKKQSINPQVRILVMPHAVSPVHITEEGNLPDAPIEEASSDVSHDASPDHSSQSGPLTSSAADKERMNLESMFDDDDDDDDGSQFLSSSALNQEPE